LSGVGQRGQGYFFGGDFTRTERMAVADQKPEGARIGERFDFRVKSPPKK
jgi:hypothetical protein